MTRMDRPGGVRWFCCLGFSVWLAAGCSSGSSGSPPVQDAASDGAAAPLTCQELRVRIRANCASEIDPACVEALIAKATPAAQTAYRALAACTLPFCPTGDSYCTCEQRCFADGNCLTETDTCVAGAFDEVCETLCH